MFSSAKLLYCVFANKTLHLPSPSAFQVYSIRVNGIRSSLDKPKTDEECEIVQHEVASLNESVGELMCNKNLDCLAEKHGFEPGDSINLDSPSLSLTQVTPKYNIIKDTLITSDDEEGDEEETSEESETETPESESEASEGQSDKPPKKSKGKGKKNKDKNKKDKDKNKKDKDKDKKDKKDKDRKDKKDKDRKDKKDKDKGKGDAEVVDKKDKDKKGKDKKDKDKDKKDKDKDKKDKDRKDKKTKDKDKDKGKGKGKDKGKGKGKGKDNEKGDDSSSDTENTGNEDKEGKDEKGKKDIDKKDKDKDKGKGKGKGKGEGKVKGKDKDKDTSGGTEDTDEQVQTSNESRTDEWNQAGCLPNNYPGYSCVPSNISVICSETGSYESLCNLIRLAFKCADRALTMTPWGTFVIFKSRGVYLLYDGCTCNVDRFRHLDITVGTAGLICIESLNDLINRIIESGREKCTPDWESKDLQHVINKICDNYCH